MEVVEETMVANEGFFVIQGPCTGRSRPSSPFASSIGGSTSGGGGEDGDGRDYDHGNDGSSSSTVEFFKDMKEEEDMANCLILLAHGRNKITKQRRKRVETREGLDVYECKTCNRSFPSFQALGGHRASHKKPKTAGNEEKKVSCQGQLDSNNKNSDPSLSFQADHHKTSISKVHECSICGSEFSSGQALGGHMRRHRNTIAMNKEQGNDNKPRNIFTLDLNLPAPEDDVFSSKQPSLVFSAPPLVDCHY